MLSLTRLPRRSTRRHWTEVGEHRVAIVSSAAPIRGLLRLPPDASLNDRPTSTSTVATGLVKMLTATGTE
jgi:hypothetical protein